MASPQSESGDRMAIASVGRRACQIFEAAEAIFNSKSTSLQPAADAATGNGHRIAICHGRRVVVVVVRTWKI